MKLLREFILIMKMKTTTALKFFSANHRFEKNNGKISENVHCLFFLNFFIRLLYIYFPITF